MLKEFAVDPEALTADWKDFKYVTEKFGVEHGRVISAFPKHWLRDAIEAVQNNDNLKPVRKKSMVERLRLLKRRRRLLSFSRAWDGTRLWRENALAQHEEKPFHRLLVGETLAELLAGDLEALDERVDLVNAADRPFRFLLPYDHVRQIFGHRGQVRQ